MPKITTTTTVTNGTTVTTTTTVIEYNDNQNVVVKNGKVSIKGIPPVKPKISAMLARWIKEIEALDRIIARHPKEVEKVDEVKPLECVVKGDCHEYIATRDQFKSIVKEMKQRDNDTEMPTPHDMPDEGDLGDGIVFETGEFVLDI